MEKDKKLYYALKRTEFIKVRRANRLYYGGNQAWFDKEIARDSACGTVAAANIWAYLFVGKNKSTSLNKDSDDFGKTIYNLDEYKGFMDEVYKHLYPINISYSRGGFDLFYKFMKIFHLDNISLGIPTITRFSRGFKNFVNSLGMEVEAVVYPRSFLSGWTKLGAVDFISRALEEDKPVALLNTFNKGLKGLEYEAVSGEKRRGNFDRHWIVITGMLVDESSEKVYLYASSWGEKVRIDLDAVLRGGLFKRMIYFKN